MTNDEIMALEGDALDCAVAVANGWEKCGDSLQLWGVIGEKTWIASVKRYHPSFDGQQMLEIMEREKISANFEFDGCWSADNYIIDTDKNNDCCAHGKTINEAVLRCYLASKQGGNNG